MIEGYDADIPQGFWRRITQHGLPVKWLGAWLAGAIIQVTFCITLLELWWLWSLGCGVGLAVGELVLGAWLTRADADWDTLIIDQWRYRHHYEAE
jgi:hypothetical protein